MPSLRRVGREWCAIIDMDDASFASGLNAGICEALEIADRSSDVRDEEVALVKIVAFIEAHPEHRQAAEETMVDLLTLLEHAPAPLGLVELLAYCVHVVGFPQVIEVARVRQAAALAEFKRGATGRHWEHARAMERVIDADNPEWDDADMFTTLSSERSDGGRSD